MLAKIKKNGLEVSRFILIKSGEVIVTYAVELVSLSRFQGRENNEYTLHSLQTAK